MSEGQAGDFTDEVRITPEMLEAGVDAYYKLGDIREPEDVVTLIFEAMATVGRRSASRP